MAIVWQCPDPRVRFWHEEAIAHLDIRELLIEGGRPYELIMACVGKMGRGDTLAIHALFEPKPLIARLQRRGFICGAHREGEDHWIVNVLNPR